MLELRTLTPDVWALWRGLRLAALAEAPEAFGATLAEWSGPGDTEERWRARLTIPGARDLVALLDGRSVGMATGVQGDVEGSVGLISMWVSPEARGRGVGDRLMQAVEQWGLEQGATTLRLAVMPDNEQASALYERHGYADTGELGEPGPDGGPRERILAKRLRRVALRAMTAADVPLVLAIEEPAAIAGLAAVFPQDDHPFPREVVARRWLEEIDTPGIDCFVVTTGDAAAGFAAVRDAELLHFGVALEHWGTGLAQEAHDALLDVMRRRGVTRAWLRVFTGNGRGRAFYEKLGWSPTGERTRSTFPPQPELLRYERDLVEPAAG